MRSFLYSLILLLASHGFLWSQNEFEEGLTAANKKDYKMAIQIFEKAVAQEPKNVSALVNLGNCYFEEKLLSKALVNYEKALKINPNDDEIIQNIQSCYASLENQEVYTSPYGKIDLILYRIGGFTWEVLSIIFALIASYFLFRLLKSKKHFRLQNSILLSFSLVFMLLFIYFSRQVYLYQSLERNAIVIAKNATICKNDMGELSGISLKEGSRINIIEETAEFYKFKDQVGNLLFLRKGEAERF